MRLVEYEWIKVITSEIRGKILDVGSRDVEERPDLRLRNLFTHHDYVGLDAIDGPNVDVVHNAHGILSIFGPETFDCVCCCNVFEHDPQFWITLQNCRVVLKRGGLLILAAANRQEGMHEHPVDCYRFIPWHIASFLHMYRDVSVWEDRKQRVSAGCGIKPPWMRFNWPVRTRGNFLAYKS